MTASAPVIFYPVDCCDCGLTCGASTVEHSTGLCDRCYAERMRRMDEEDRCLPS